MKIFNHKELTNKSKGLIENNRLLTENCRLLAKNQKGLIKNSRLLTNNLLSQFHDADWRNTTKVCYETKKAGQVK